MQKKSTSFFVSFETPFGWLSLEASELCLKSVRFGSFSSVGALSSFGWLMELKSAILDYLWGKRVSFSKFPLCFDSLSSMQLKVLSEVNKIPYGSTVSYKELASRVGGGATSSIGARACGRILASNPFPIIIPCHRVVCSDGSLGGYSGGIEWKQKLLALEATKFK